MRARNLRKALAGQVLAASRGPVEGAAFAARCSAMVAVVAGAMVAMAVPAGAQAQQDMRMTFRIPAQPLVSALRAFASQGRQQLLFDEERLQGLQAPALEGSHTASEALTRLLTGTGMLAVQASPGLFTIKEVPAAGAAALLDTVTVSGKAPGSTTEGTGSYTTWSTSSSTRLNLSQQETPQAVTVLTRQRMDDQKLSNVIEALEATPGIIVQRTTVGQDGLLAYARGSVLRNYQIDGVPVFHSMSPFLGNTVAFDRIEIVRGATGIMNGLGTPAATVNMIRKRPTAERKLSLTAEAGNWSRYGAGLDASGALNEDKSLRGRLVADTRHENAWVDRFQQTGMTLYGIGELDLGRDTLLTAGFSHLRQDSRSAIQGRPLYFGDGTPNRITPADNMSQPWRYYDQTSSSVFASVEHRFGRNWVGKAEYSRARYHYDGRIATIWTPANASGAGSSLYASRWDNSPRLDNLDAYVTGAFPLFGRTHELTAGMTVSRLKDGGPSYARDPGDSININYYDWVNAPEPRFIASGLSHSREQQKNAFVSARLSVADASHLLLGGRWTHWSKTGSAGDRKENVFVPYIGLVHVLDDTWSVYGSYTKIFQPQSDNVRRFGGSGIAPEEGTGYEAGVKASFLDDRLTSSLSLFQTELDNLAAWNLAAYRYEVQGLTKTRGVELELNGELAKRWQLSAGYALARSKDGRGQQVLTYVPRQSFKLFTSYRLGGAWSRLTLGGGVHWQSSMRSGLAIDHHQGSVALVQLMARYEVDKHLSVSLNLNNALNKPYFSTIANNYGTYGAPRNLVLSAQYRF